MFGIRPDRSHPSLTSPVKSLQTAAQNSHSLDNSFTSSQRQRHLGKSSLAAASHRDSQKTLQLQSSGSDWITQNLQDSSVRSAASSRWYDGILDRLDMISIFRSAKDGKRVDQTELKDLRKLVNNGDRLGMTEPVQVLSRKVAFSNYANRNYQGNKLGNLKANSAGHHLEKLVNKWFFGGDRPVASGSDGLTSYTYEPSTAPLFENGVNYSDIAQGDVGDCYLLAGLAATALRTPEQIQNMFIDNGDGTFTVRFYKDSGAADYVTVDRTLPVDAWGLGIPAYADHSSELWVALAEKAYAQWNESAVGAAYLGDVDHTNSYQGISGGDAERTTRHITGRQTDWSFMPEATPEAIASAFDAGQLITFGSTENPASRYIEEKHAYTLVGYDAVTQQFTLYNPWGNDGLNSRDSDPTDGRVELSWTELSNNFDYWNFTV